MGQTGQFQTIPQFYRQVHLKILLVCINNISNHHAFHISRPFNVDGQHLVTYMFVLLTKTFSTPLILKCAPFPHLDFQCNMKLCLTNTEGKRCHIKKILDFQPNVIKKTKPRQPFFNVLSSLTALQHHQFSRMWVKPQFEKCKHSKFKSKS